MVSNTILLDSSHHAGLRRVGSRLAMLALLMLFIWWAPALPGLRGVAGYEPLHTFFEVTSIVVSGLIFAVIWNAPHGKLQGNMVLLASAFVGVALLDFSHLLSIQGMPDYVTPGDAEKAINFWLAARLLAAAALLCVALTRWQIFELGLTRFALMGGVLTFVALVHWVFLLHPELMPRTFVKGQGLTAFKRTAEYVLIALNLVAALALLWRMRRPLSFNAAALLGAIVTMAMSESFFTLYGDVTDIYLVAGHAYKIVSYLFLYRAVFVEAIERPYREITALQSQLKATLNAVPDMIFELDLQGHCLGYHSPPTALLPEPVEHYLGRSVFDILPQSAAQTAMAAVREAYDKGVSVGHQLDIHLPDGRRWFELSVARKAPGSDDPSERLIILARDVTERQMAAERLRQSEQSLAITLQSIGDAVIATDAQGHITRMNTTAERLTGWPLQQALGRPLPEVFHVVNDQTRSVITNPVQLVMAQGETVGLANHTALVARDGSEYQISDSAAPIRNPKGDIVGVVLVFSDVTQKYRAEEALRASEERFRSLTKLSSDWFWEQDADLRFVRLDGEASVKADLLIPSYVGKARWETQAFNLAESDWEAHKAQLDAHLPFRDFHMQKLDLSGQTRWVSVSGEPIFDAQGRFTGYRGVGSDITERVLAQQALRASLQEKVGLLNEVHHRVKNNLQVIASLLRLEAGRSSQSTTKAMLADMQGRIRSMAILHESLYRTGVFASVDLAAYLRQLATQAFRTLAPSSGAVRLQLDLESAHVGMDLATPFGLLVNELIANSLKHGFPAKIGGEVRIELHPEPGPHREAGAPVPWRLSVSDTGVGLPADFEIRRGESLGLQLVSDLVKQLDGKLEIGPDAQAIFTVVFEVPPLASAVVPESN